MRARTQSVRVAQSLGAGDSHLRARRHGRFHDRSSRRWLRLGHLIHARVEGLQLFFGTKAGVADDLVVEMRTQSDAIVTIDPIVSPKRSEQPNLAEGIRPVTEAPGSQVFE